MTLTISLTLTLLSDVRVRLQSCKAAALCSSDSFNFSTEKNENCLLAKIANLHYDYKHLTKCYLFKRK